MVIGYVIVTTLADITLLDVLINHQSTNKVRVEAVSERA